MTFWIVTLCLCACVTVAAGDKEPSAATCDALANTVKTEGMKRGDGPAHTFCGETLSEKQTAFCICQVVPRKRELKLSEFLTPVKAKSFLSDRNIAKRTLSEECCNKSCYWEEIHESCY